MNEYDSNRILDLTKKINYFPSDSIEESNCYILNTCHIREKATDKVYHDIGRLKKEFRNKLKPIVLIAGCVAQAEGEILLKREKYIELLDSIMNNILSKEFKTVGGDQGVYTYHYNSGFEPKIKLDYTNKFGVNTFQRSHDEYYVDNGRLVSKNHGTLPLFLHDNGWNHGSPRYLDHFKLRDLYE